MNDSPDFCFSIPIQIRFADTDVMGHVNNAVYLTYFELARVEYFRSIVGREVDESLEQSFIIGEAHVVFKAPARMGESLQVLARISRFGTKSFDFSYRIINTEHGAVICEGSTVQVMYDYVRNATILLPQDFIQRVESFERQPVARS
ncbi:MAG: acyl-CoA thioesterase [Ignavibacteria bacterium]|nr:acyl-CoA thioesterase [Ignavibacteria bacterium]